MKASVEKFDNRFVIKPSGDAFTVWDTRDDRMLKRFYNFNLASAFREAVEKCVFDFEFRKIAENERWGGWMAY